MVVRPRIGRNRACQAASKRELAGTDPKLIAERAGYTSVAIEAESGPIPDDLMAEARKAIARQRRRTEATPPQRLILDRGADRSLGAKSALTRTVRSGRYRTRTCGLSRVGQITGCCDLGVFNERASDLVFLVRLVLSSTALFWVVCALGVHLTNAMISPWPRW